MPLRLDSKADGFDDAFDAFLALDRAPAADLRETVAAIIADVRAGGDQALCAITKKFDGFAASPDTIRVGADEIEGAAAACDEDILSALALAADRIRDFHARQVPEDLAYTDHAGLGLGYRWTALAAAGLYVPGGTAVYPSSVLMNALPAKVAGVERIVMTVPAPGGDLDPLVLAAAHLAGVDEIYRVGGAQAIAALAFGTQTIAPVDKIFGPGNAYVAEAKRQVFGAVGIDMIAGPSEILVLADGANDPAWIAADLLSQAEHDAAAQAILMTDDGAFAGAVEAAMEDQLKTLPRGAIAGQSWQRFGAVITLADLDEAPALIDRIAPEHLELAVEDADALAAKVRNAGAVFLGRHAPEALGDYVAGPNHVLPTMRAARFASGLGVLDFMKRTTMIGASAAALAAVGPAAVTLARAEGLDAHALSIALRLGTRSKK